MIVGKDEMGILYSVYKKLSPTFSISLNRVNQP